MKRPLFVFAGQSNMMGAAALSPKENFSFENSYEYLHKPRRMGASLGKFKKEAFPVGEFSYKDLKRAYGPASDVTQKSPLTHYTENTFFCPAMANADSLTDKTVRSFQDYSEATFQAGTSFAPYFVRLLERAGLACAYTHMAKGMVRIEHYTKSDAWVYFDQKVVDFFSDSEKIFSEDDTQEKIFVWLQGESSALMGYDGYKQELEALWQRIKPLGFTKFFMLRVGFWGKPEILDIMRAQEDFCKEYEDVFMLTRVCSFFAYFGQQIGGWFKDTPCEEFSFCRDSFYGFDNQHINDKGFQVLAKYAAQNALRILLHNLPPILEEENILPLI